MLICGLELVHSQGIIHRGVEPVNLMLDGCGHCLTGDFGSSKFISVGCRLPREVTTLQYAAPEQSMCFGCANKVEVSSFAVVLHETLGGESDA
jgi:serine/threonine protein kinase